MKILTYIKIGLTVIAVVLLIVGFFWLKNLTKNDHIDFGPDEDIGITPTQIQSIKAIGEWEFLSVSAEELVDTTRRRLIMKDELARIYYGTLRLGVDMHQVNPGWIKASGDSITMTLPAISLLDKDFIDEARTKPFYESGSWTTTDREALYKKAYRMMTQHCLTKENLQAAEANGQEQFTNMLKSMGYKHVKVTFQR
ncbi:MAG: DUF4230 domain-containing protein [Prevotella sp.]|nr:DUF4230 domain-containing protein [Prevotella sp.]